MSLYETLQISPNATKRQIKDSYIKLVRIYHPDKLGRTPSDSDNEMYIKIQTAYEILYDPQTRKNYDMVNFNPMNLFGGIANPFAGVNSFARTNSFAGSNPFDSPNSNRTQRRSRPEPRQYSTYYNPNHKTFFAPPYSSTNHEPSGLDLSQLECFIYITLQELINGFKKKIVVERLSLMRVNYDPYNYRPCELCKNKCSEVFKVIGLVDENFCTYDCGCAASVGNFYCLIRTPYEFTYKKKPGQLFDNGIISDGNFNLRTFEREPIEIIINIEKYSNGFYIEDDQLFMKAEASIFDCLTGMTIEFDHLNGRHYKRKLEPFSHDDIPKIEGLGLPFLDEGDLFYDDLNISFDISYPKLSTEHMLYLKCLKNVVELGLDINFGTFPTSEFEIDFDLPQDLNLPDQELDLPDQEIEIEPSFNAFFMKDGSNNSPMI